MCEHCRQNPCHPRCPNADDPEIKGVCAMCGKKLRADYTYVEDNDGNVFCEEDCAIEYYGIEEKEWDDG